MTATTTTFETLMREQLIAMGIPAGWVIAVEEVTAHDDRFTLVLVNETVARSAERKLEPHCRRSCLDTYFGPILPGARKGNSLAMRLKSRRAFDDQGRCDQWDDAPADVDRTPIRQADRDRLQKGLAMTSTIDLIYVEHSDLEPLDVVVYAFGGERYTLLREVSRYEFEVRDESGAIMTRRFYNPNAAFMVWGGPKLVAAQVDKSLIQKKPVGWHWIGDKLGSADVVATDPKSSELDQQEEPVNPFAKLYEQAAEANAKHEAHQAELKRRENALHDRQQMILLEWFKRLLTNLGIICEPTELTVTIGGCEFRLGGIWPDFSPLRVTINGMNQPAWKVDPDWHIDKVEVKDFEMEWFELSITNVALLAEYRELNIWWSDNVRMRGDSNWTEVAARVAAILDKLTAAAAAAPERKREHDQRKLAEQEQAQRDEVARQAQEAEIAAARAAENQRYETARQEREAKEARLRAEVAAKFEVSAEAFDHLITTLVDEINRRQIVPAVSDYNGYDYGL